MADTPPLISLMKCNCLGILQDLFGEVQIPEAVYAELTSNPKFAEEAITITNCEFIHKVKIDDQKTVALFNYESISGFLARIILAGTPFIMFSNICL